MAYASGVGLEGFSFETQAGLGAGLELSGLS